MPDLLDEVYGAEALPIDEYARRSRAFNEQSFPMPSPQSSGADFGPSPEEAPAPRRIDPNYANFLGSLVQRGDISQEQADRHLAEGTTYRGQGATTAPPQQTQAPRGPQDRQRFIDELFGAGTARRVVTPSGQPLISPAEGQLLDAQHALDTARLGPDERRRLQELNNGIYQVDQQLRQGTIFPVDGYAMREQLMAELQPLRARAAQVPLLTRQLAAIQMQQDHAVASTVDQQRQAFAASNAQSRVHTATLADGTVVQLMKDDAGRFHTLHDQPIVAIPEGFRNEREIAETVRRRQIEFWNRNVAGIAGADHNWPNRAAQIEHDVRSEAHQHRSLAQQTAREQRLGGQTQGLNTQQMSGAFRAIDAQVDKDVQHYLDQKHKAETANPPRAAPEPPMWMQFGDRAAGPTNTDASSRPFATMQEAVQAEKERRRRAHLQALGVNPPGGGQGQVQPNQAAFDALMQRLLTLPRR